MVVVGDKKKGADESMDGIIEYYNADVVTANDYYPFGMYQPGRGYNSGYKYRYGYNSKENDNEVKGEGNQQDYGMRIYDPRVGRFLSIDPLTGQYPELTPYQFASNTPIWGVDRDGLEIEPFQMLRAQQRIRENRAKMTPEELKKDNQLSLTIGIGVSALPVVIYAAPVATPIVTSSAVVSNTLTTAATATTSAAIWASRNPQLLKEGGDVVLGFLNPTAQDIDPSSSSDEIGRAINQGFRYVIKGLSFGDNFLSGIKRVTFAADEVKNLISTEENAQGGVEAIKKILTSGNKSEISRVWASDIITTTYNNKKYILNGHNRLKALSELGEGVPAEARVLEISTEEAMNSYKDVMEYIKKDQFNLKISE